MMKYNVNLMQRIKGGLQRGAWKALASATGLTTMLGCVTGEGTTFVMPGTGLVAPVMRYDAEGKPVFGMASPLGVVYEPSDAQVNGQGRVPHVASTVYVTPQQRIISPPFVWHDDNGDKKVQPNEMIHKNNVSFVAGNDYEIAVMVYDSIGTQIRVLTTFNEKESGDYDITVCTNPSHVTQQVRMGSGNMRVEFYFKDSPNVPPARIEFNAP